MNLGFLPPSPLPLDIGIRKMLDTLDRVQAQFPALRNDRAQLARRSMDLCRDSVAILASVVKGGSAALQLAERHAKSAAEFARLLKDGGERG